MKYKKTDDGDTYDNMSPEQGKQRDKEAKASKHASKRVHSHSQASKHASVVQ